MQASTAGKPDEGPVAWNYFSRERSAMCQATGLCWTWSGRSLWPAGLDRALLGFQETARARSQGVLLCAPFHVCAGVLPAGAVGSGSSCLSLSKGKGRAGQRTAVPHAEWLFIPAQLCSALHRFPLFFAPHFPLLKRFCVVI